MTDPVTVVPAVGQVPTTAPLLPFLPREITLSDVALTFEEVQRWLATTGLRILVTILLAVIALWVLRRLINRVVATMTSKSAGRRTSSIAQESTSWWVSRTSG